MNIGNAILNARNRSKEIFHAAEDKNIPSEPLNTGAKLPQTLNEVDAKRLFPRVGRIRRK